MRQVELFECEECHRTFATSDEAARCERDDRSLRDQERKRKRWHAIDDEQWCLADADLDAIEAIVKAALARARSTT